MEKTIKQKDRLIVSLTTFPARINRIWIVIECMLRQKEKPDKIILWLSKEQFSSLDVLPKKLLDLRSRGLEIVLCDEDLRSHKKYYYALKEYPEDIIITVDDDVFYPSDTLERLIELSKRYPNCVCFHRGLQLTFNESEIRPYKEWEYLTDFKGPSYDLLLTGCGGVLYPPHSLHKDVLEKDLFMTLCKNADDLWLYSMSLYNGTRLVKSKDNIELIPIYNKGDVTLASSNVDDGHNDKQLLNIRNYFLENRFVDVLENSFKKNKI
ncbi:glycosyltransferase [Sphingobacterium lactis]|uniref:glycosyltransferase n=1 Tax=Sphingobacterium lactis TaxID=797291 RepID=UPI003F823D4A